MNSTRMENYIVVYRHDVDEEEALDQIAAVAHRMDGRRSPSATLIASNGTADPRAGRGWHAAGSVGVDEVVPFQRGRGTAGRGGRNAEEDFRGEKRSNATHESSTDPQALQYRKSKGQEAKLCYLGHALMDNRHGLIVDTRTTQARGRAERESALAMIEARPGKGRLTVGADKGYDTRDFVEGLRWANVSPHVAQNQTNRRSAIDGRTTRHAGYAQSQRVRKRIEEAFGWAKTVGGLRKLKHRGLPKVDFQFTLTFAAYNLVRLRTLGVGT